MPDQLPQPNIQTPKPYPARRPAPVAKPKLKMDALEWGLLAGLAVMIDIAQAVLDTFVIGGIINRFVDIMVGLIFAFIFMMKGLLDWKLTASLLLAFLIEEIPYLDMAPAWSGDIAYAYFTTDGAKIVGAMPVVGAEAEKAMKMAAQKGGRT